VAAEGEQARLIALNKRLEGPVMTPPDERYETLVGLKPKEGRSPCKRRQTCGMLKC